MVCVRACACVTQSHTPPTLSSAVASEELRRNVTGLIRRSDRLPSVSVSGGECVCECVCGRAGIHAAHLSRPGLRAEDACGTDASSPPREGGG